MEEKLNHYVSHDFVYQQLLRECLTLEPEYCRIRDSLPPQERELLERYLALCEEMDHRRLTLALTLALALLTSQ